MFDGKGMRVDGVSEGKPAIKQELQKGDIVIKLGDNRVTDMMSYMKALAVLKKEIKQLLLLTRKGKEVKADIQF